MPTLDLDPDIFVLAAEMVCPWADSFLGYPCSLMTFVCVALSDAPHEEYFSAVLKPKDAPTYYPWYQDNPKPMMGTDEYVRQQNSRVFGLLLCAELVKDGFIP